MLPTLLNYEEELGDIMLPKIMIANFGFILSKFTLNFSYSKHSMYNTFSASSFMAKFSL
jgi:hypothetical protein